MENLENLPRTNTNDSNPCLDKLLKISKFPDNSSVSRLSNDFKQQVRGRGRPRSNIFQSLLFMLAEDF
jgi:hypothetical protein